LGLDPKVLASIVNTSSGRCWSSDTANPVPDVIATAPSTNKYNDGFKSRLMLKDLGLVSNAAKESKTPLMLGALAENIYRHLANDATMSEKDFSQKKVKAWQEGTAHYNSESNDLVLFDAGNQRIASYRLRAKDSIELSSEYDIGRFLLTLETEQGEAHGIGTTKSTEAAMPSPAPATGALSGRGALKRARKLPSLIKPIQIKATATATAPEPGLEGPPCSAKDQPVAPAASEPVSEAVEYAVLYTTQRVKKVKAWAEGTLSFFPVEQRVRLQGEDGGTLTSTHLPKSKAIEVGGELDVGIYLIQIEC
ncbi:hypothetical protein FBU31_007685, partial [Coemansia sp. 'formosensis']